MCRNTNIRGFSIVCDHVFLCDSRMETVCGNVVKQIELEKRVNLLKVCICDPPMFIVNILQLCGCISMTKLNHPIPAKQLTQTCHNETQNNCGHSH